jgi:hypothetical protein
VNIASALARWTGWSCPVRSLIDRAEEISVVTQSLMTNSSGACAASQPALHARRGGLMGQCGHQQRRVEIQRQ